MNIFDWIWAPLQFDFMQQAVLITITMAVPTALLSCFLVVRGWALLGDAISHAVFPGIVLAYMLAIPLELGAMAAALICTLSIGYLQNHCRLKQDTLIGVVFSGMFGLGIVLYTGIRSEVHLDHILFGDMLGVSLEDLRESALIAALIAGVIVLKWRDFLLYAFDPVLARIVGLSTFCLHYGMLLMLSLTVVGGLKAVGVILVIALLIGPGAIALLLTRNFARMLVIATVISTVISVGSVILSFHLDSAPAPTIVVCMTSVFLIALAWESWQGRRKASAVPGQTNISTFSQFKNTR